MDQEHLPVSQDREESPRKLRGLYRHVKISVKTLDKIIIALIVVLVLCLAFGIAKGGYTVTFDPRGGTDVAQQKDLHYGDTVLEPEPPTREGYTFEGWYTDENLSIPWDFENDQVGNSMELYAKWTPVNPQ